MYIVHILAYLVVGWLWGSGASLYYDRKRVSPTTEWVLNILLWPFFVIAYGVSSIALLREKWRK